MYNHNNNNNNDNNNNTTTNNNNNSYRFLSMPEQPRAGRWSTTFK